MMQRRHCWIIFFFISDGNAFIVSVFNFGMQVVLMKFFICSIRWLWSLLYLIFWLYLHDSVLNPCFMNCICFALWCSYDLSMVDPMLMSAILNPFLCQWKNTTWCLCSSVNCCTGPLTATNLYALTLWYIVIHLFFCDMLFRGGSLHTLNFKHNNLCLIHQLLLRSIYFSSTLWIVSAFLCCLCGNRHY